MRRWVPLAFVLLAWLVAPRAARAEEDRCAAAWGLSGLKPEEQAALAEVCRKQARPDASLLPALSSVGTRATWESSALAGILAGAGPHFDLGAGAEQAGQAGRLRALRRGLQAGLVERRAGAASKTDGRCGWVRAALDEYAAALAAGEVPAPPIAGYALAQDRCLELDPAWTAEVNFVTIAADGATGLTVVAATADRVVVQALTAAEAVSHAGRQIFVVAVPRLSVVSIEASHPGGLSARWHGFVARDLTVWDRAPRADCLRVSIDLDPDTTLLLDGRPLTRGRSLTHRTVGVLGAEHELVAVRCAAGSPACTVSFREALTPGTVVRNLCQEIKIDLHRRSSVAVLGAEAAPGCDKGLTYKVGVQAEDYLRASASVTGREFRDLKLVASATEALASLKSSLNPASGQAVGATTGSDSLDQLGTVAKEAWRQGIDSLLSFELRCEASGGAPGYRVVGSRLAVREVLGRQRGDVAGLDLQRMVVIESLHVRHAAQIPAAVGGVIDRLFEADYARLLVGDAALPYRRSAEVEVSIFFRNLEAGAIGRVPKVEAIQIGDLGRPAPEICGQLARAERTPAQRAAAREFLASRTGRRFRGRVLLRRSDAGEDEANARSASYIASVRPGPPGIYMIVTRGQDGEAVEDAVCLRFEVPQSEIWGGLAIAFDATARAAIKDYQWLHLRAQVGRTFYPRRPWLGFGVVGGYTLSRYISHEGLPSWQDVTVDPSGSDGVFEWERHGVVVGPLVELRTRKATFPLELRARAAIVGGLGIVAVGRLPQQFSSFVTRDPLNNPNVRFVPNFDAVFDVGASYSAGRVTIGHTLFFGAVAVNDMLRSKHAATALNGGGLVFGLSLMIGGGL